MGVQGRRWLRWAKTAWAVAYLRSKGVTVGSGVCLNGRPRIGLARRGALELGDRVVLTSRWTANDLDAPTPCTIRSLTSQAAISIGEDSGLTSATISCAARISIGARVLVGSGVIITDTDHHP